MQYIDCFIDPITRTVSYPAGTTIVQRDTNVEILKFHYSLDAEHALENDSIRIMVLKDGETYGFSAENVRIEANDGGDDELVFEHTITTLETVTPGPIAVSVCGNQVSGDVITEAWHTLNMTYQVTGAAHTESDEGEDTPETMASNAEKIAALQVMVDAISSGNPVPVESASMMEDESVIYLYTGNEQGYSPYYWYYYDYEQEKFVPGSRYGGPSDEGIEIFVHEWLDEHPEATTTVENGSITEAKLADALKPKTMNGYVTPEMYGAKGDGVTDDTSALQDAFDAGGWIVFKSGATYKTTSPLNIKGNTFADLNGAAIIGTAHRLFYNFVDNDVFTGYNGNGNIHFRNGKISGGCITFWHGENISFENIKFSHCVCDHFIEIAACKGVYIHNCEFIGMAEQTYSAVYEYINIDPCTDEATTYFGGETFLSGNYDGTKNRDVYIVGCLFDIDANDANYQFLDDAIGCHTPWGQHHDNINIIGNKILNFKKFAIRASDMQNSVIRDNYIESGVNTEYAIACYSKDPDTVPSVINLAIQSNIIKVAKNCISAMSTRYLSAINNIYFPGDNANHAIVDLYGAITDHATIVGNKSNVGFTTAYSLSIPHLSDQVFEALQETLLTGVSVANGVVTSANVKFTEFSEFKFLFGYVSNGTFRMRTVRNWYNDKTFSSGKTYPIIVDDTTGDVLMSFSISSENENVMTITKASGVTFPFPRGTLVSK